MKEIKEYHTYVRYGENVVEVDLDDYYTVDEIVAKLRTIAGKKDTREAVDSLVAQGAEAFKPDLGVLRVRFRKQN